MRLTDPSLYRLLDSMDVCQSVLLSFFVRAAAGQYDLEQPQELLKLLVVMAWNKLVRRRAGCAVGPQTAGGRWLAAAFLAVNTGGLDVRQGPQGQRGHLVQGVAVQQPANGLEGDRVKGP